LRTHIFITLTLLGLLGTFIAAIHDGARSVARSRLVWSNFNDFLQLIGFFDISSEPALLAGLGTDFFEFANRFLLPAPLVLILGVFSILCYLASYRRPKG